MEFDQKTFVLGVGAQKAGTTWLFDYLSKRGDIYMPRKEIHFFNMKYTMDKERRGPRGGEAGNHPGRAADYASYREFFERKVPRDYSHFGEITPAYATIGSGKFRNIRRLFRHVRTIFIMRDPVDRLYSQLRMYQDKASNGEKPQRDPDRLIASPKFLERSRYELTIDRLESVFGADEIIYLFYETLFCDESIETLCRYLELSYKPADFHTQINSRGPRPQIPGHLQQRLLTDLAPTYRFCCEKFGELMPAQWRSRLQQQFRREPDSDPGLSPVSAVNRGMYSAGVEEVQ